MIGIICPSPKGRDIAFKLQDSLNANLYIKEKNNIDLNEMYIDENKVSEKSKDNSYDYLKYNKFKTYRYTDNFNLSEVTKKAFNECNKIIFISSTGIAVRGCASLLQGKDKDPGIVVVDLSSKYAISLLSGHLGGGNELTLQVSDILGCEPIITTATDTMNIIAPDIIAKKNNLVIDDLKKAKYIAALLVDGKEVGVKDSSNIMKITKGYKKIDTLKEDSIWITDKLIYKENEKIDYSKILKLIKKDIVLGIGCRRNTPYEKLKSFIEETLKKYNYDLKSVNKIVSVEIKKDEQGIIKLAEYIDCPFETFNIDEIKTVQDKYDKSEFVLKTLGVTSVCEPCVDLGGAEVIISKIKHEGMTLAIGKFK